MSASVAASWASNRSVCSLTFLRTLATWACHSSRMSCHCDDTFSRSPSALSLNRLAAAAAFLSCGSGVGSELIVGFITGCSERVGRRFRSVGDLLELCAEIVVCHRALLHQLRWAYSQRGHFRQGQAALDNLRRTGVAGHCLLGRDRRRLIRRWDNRSGKVSPMIPVSSRTVRNR